MAEYIATNQQEVNPNGSVIFTDAPVPCIRGFIRHRDDSGSFLLSGYVPCKNGCRSDSALYLVQFGANIAVPTGETVGEISIAIAVDGVVIPSSTMIVNPAAVEEFWNVSRTINAQVWRGCCETLSVVNTSDIPILVTSASVVFSRPDMDVTY